MQRRTLIGLLGTAAAMAALPRTAAHPTWQGLQQARRHLQPRRPAQARARENRPLKPPRPPDAAVVVKDELALHRRP